MKENIINWNEYQQGALTTAIYPLKRELEYTILGLCSEVGEIGEAYEVGNGSWGLNNRSIEAVLDEIGDCWWYAAAVTDAMKRTFEEVRTWTQTFDVSHSPTITILRIQKHASKIAGILKKSIRDNDGYFEAKHEEAVMQELYGLTLQLSQLTLLLGSTTRGVMHKNLNKLADRKARGVLQGSGDKR